MSDLAETPRAAVSRAPKLLGYGPPQGTPWGRRVAPLAWAASASFGAGLVHLAVVPEHLHEWLLAGIFFLVLGALQLGWSVTSLALKRLVAPRTVAAANVLTVLLWAVSRTAGLPFGPEAGHPESVGRADVLASVLEVIAAAAVAFAISRRLAARR